MDIRHPIDTRLQPLLYGTERIRGLFNGLPSPAIIEMCAYAGFSFVIIDNEHGCADLETTENMLRAARASGIIPVVRCLEHDLPRVLDMGAGAVQIPMVSTAAKARELVSKVRYPRIGQRGSAFSTRAAGYGAFGGMPHTERSNRGISLIVMIETPEGVRNAAEIAAVDGVDAVFIGPNDLSHAMGFDNNWSAPDVENAMERTIRAVTAAGKCAGTVALTHEAEQKYAAWGARYFANVSTSIFTQALRKAASEGDAGSVKIEY